MLEAIRVELEIGSVDRSIFGQHPKGEAHAMMIA
jgi:hypothetical protein